MGYGGRRESALNLMRMPKRGGGGSSTYSRSRTSPTPILTIRANLPRSLVPFVPLNICMRFSRLALSKVGT